MLNTNLKSMNFTINTLTNVIVCLNISLNCIILMYLIYYGKVFKCNNRYTSRRISLLHSINIYIHITSSTIIFLIIFNRNEILIPWRCRLLNHLLSSFGIGIYGSCLLQALYHYWRIKDSKQKLFLKLYFHILCISIHWILVIVSYLPILPRKIYMMFEQYCLKHLHYTSILAYLPLIFNILPVLIIIYIYVKMIRSIKSRWQLRKQCQRIKYNTLIIRPIFFLILVLIQISCVSCVIWLVILIQKDFQPLSYEFLCLIIETGLLACSVTLLNTSLQLKRTKRSKSESKTS